MSDCKGSPTHYQGCECHEAGWKARLAASEAGAGALREALDGVRANIGVPQPEYPAPFAWAYHLACKALASTDAGSTILKELGELRVRAEKHFQASKRCDEFSQTLNKIQSDQSFEIDRLRSQLAVCVGALEKVDKDCECVCYYTNECATCVTREALGKLSV